VSRTLGRPPSQVRDASPPGPEPPTHERWPSTQWQPQSLRARATFAFTAVVLALTAVLVAGVWLTVSSYLLLQRERVTLAQTTANAGQVVRGLESGVLDPAQVLAQLPRETGSTSLLRTGEDEWSASSLRIGRDALPEQLRASVRDGTAAMQRVDVDGTTMLAIGVPLPEEDDAYFEIYSLQELDNTYRVLGIVLAAAVITVVPASVLVGWRVARPALRPLDRLAQAAAAIADGDLHTRIDPRGDPSLVPLAASFNRTAAALEERLRSDARFAADVSHELRSPLTTMLNAAALVEAYRDHLPPDGQEGLDLLRSEVRNFERLVSDLLEISRADAGSDDATLETVRLADLVRATVARHNRAADREVRPVVAPDAEDVLVRVDKRRLERVLANLMDNADKHGEGLTGVGLARDGDTATITVDDAGPGVPEAERARVFERFARGSRSGRASSDGSGLGLSLVQRHLALMDGSVSVGDSPAGGARFVVAVPVEDLP
jgi:two-component system, OmpR family, sensor histidine kinase MtrB